MMALDDPSDVLLHPRGVRSNAMRAPGIGLGAQWGFGPLSSLLFVEVADSGSDRPSKLLVGLNPEPPTDINNGNTGHSTPLSNQPIITKETAMQKDEPKYEPTEDAPSKEDFEKEYDDDKEAFKERWLPKDPEPSQN